jgi:hypothetical protein
MHSRRLLGQPKFIFSLSIPRLASAGIAGLLLGIVTGCGTAPLPQDVNASPSRPDDPAAVSSSNEQADAGSDSVFTQAQPAAMLAAGEFVIEGVIDGLTDVNVYALGPAATGDRVILDVTGQDGLNTVAALFDGAGDLIDANDDRSYYAGRLDPYIARVIREDTDNLYLGVAVSTGTNFSSTAGRYDHGAYSVRIRRDPAQPVPRAQPQVVYLNFEGGDQVQIGLEPVEVMRAFSAESISSRLAGQSEYIVELLLDYMRQDYALYNVTLLSSKHDAVPSTPYSTLYFGNYNAAYLGLADNVDTGNAFLQQKAIIYAEDLGMFEALQPSAEEVAQALANIAAHELGHLLGLEHTAEARDLMATASSARQVLETDAGFVRARLQATVFPVGWQDNPHLLALNVGVNPLAELTSRLRMADAPTKAAPTWRDLLPDIPIVQCGGCAEHADGY